MNKHLNLKDSYSVYKKSTPNPKDCKVYLDITKAYMKFLSEKLFEKGEIMLPERLGNLHIVGRKSKVVLEDGKIKGLAPDWAKTKELWDKDSEAREAKQLVYHFNEDTNGVRYKFFWSKNRVLVANKTLFNLRMTRTNKRELSDRIKKGKEYLIK